MRSEPRLIVLYHYPAAIHHHQHHQASRPVCQTSTTYKSCRSASRQPLSLNIRCRRLHRILFQDLYRFDLPWGRTAYLRYISHYHALVDWRWCFDRKRSSSCLPRQFRHPLPHRAPSLWNLCWARHAARACSQAAPTRFSPLRFAPWTSKEKTQSVKTHQSR